MESFENRLRGKGLNVQKAPEKLTEENLEGRIVIQRDSGDEFRVESVAMNERTGRLLAHMVSLKANARLNLAASDLLSKIEKPDGPWKLKE